MKYKSILGLACLGTLAGGAIAYTSVGGSAPVEGAVMSGPSRAKALAAAYEDWEKAYEKAGGDSARVMTLRQPQGHGYAKTGPWGQVKLDLVNGRVTAGVVGATEPVELWVVDNVSGAGRSSRPEPGDTMVHLGTLTPKDGVGRLEASLPVGATVDLAVMTPAGKRPDEGSFLVAHSNLFQRLYDRAKSKPIATLAPRAADGTLARTLGPDAALADVVGGTTDTLEDLVAEGEILFTEETFGGNERTCASCHPVLNNTTIDETFIAKLPYDDPLFVAEFDAALADLESPELMREFALIKENQDGMDDLENKFNMRGVPHTLALPTSLDVFLLDDAGEIVATVEATGWAGDGAPNGATPADGALRLFANGAINQHFPRTLDRVEGVDFRLATDEELDAMEAFQLSLGRQDELDLATMNFRNSKVQEGKLLFTGTFVPDPITGVPDFGRKCNFCHVNAGANDIGQHPFGDGEVISAGNLNLNTGVEDIPLDTSLGRRPRDGGLGTEFDKVTPLNPLFDADANGVVDFPADPRFNCSDEPQGSGGFGDGTFNIPTLVEAADTPPFFHNNAVATLEESVAFYGTEHFNCSPGGRAVGGIIMAEGDPEKISAFLRAINVLENIRSSEQYLSDAMGERYLGFAKPKLDGAHADIEDAVQVLTEGKLHTADASRKLQRALLLVKMSGRITNTTARNALLQQARFQLAQAHNLIEE